MKKLKQIAALAGAVILVAIVVFTCIISFIDAPWAKTLFPGMIAVCIGLPVVLYCCILMYRYLKNKDK